MRVLKLAGGFADVEIWVVSMFLLHYFDFVFVYLVILLDYAISLVKKVLLLLIWVENELCLRCDIIFVNFHFKLT